MADITVSAKDALGAVSSATVTATQQSGGTVTIPLSMTDTRFSANKPGQVFSNPVSQGPTGTIANLDWIQSPNFSSGDQVWTWNGGNLNMNQCRIDCREGPRIAGNGGTFHVDQCFINCVGKGSDHADAFQAYSPHDIGNITITNSCIRAYSDTAARTKYGSGFVGSTALFWADYYSGLIKFDNVLLIGGSRVVTVNCDAGTTHVDFNNVFFIGDSGQTWQFSSVQDGGKLVVDNWTNVCNATIVNGVIVPGTAIPKP
jgi:hypothetical protein